MVKPQFRGEGSVRAIAWRWRPEVPPRPTEARGSLLSRQTRKEREGQRPMGAGPHSRDRWESRNPALSCPPPACAGVKHPGAAPARPHPQRSPAVCVASL